MHVFQFVHSIDLTICSLLINSNNAKIMQRFNYLCVFLLFFALCATILNASAQEGDGGRSAGYGYPYKRHGNNHHDYYRYDRYDRRHDRYRYEDNRRHDRYRYEDNRRQHYRFARSFNVEDTKQ